MSKKSQMKVLAGPQTVEAPTEERMREKRAAAAEARRTLSTLLPDKIANSTFWVRNQPLPRGREIFPLEWKMQFADIFYPHAEGGPLYVDMPRTEWDVQLCKRKLTAMKTVGVRYLYISTGMDENECRQMLEAKA